MVALALGLLLAAVGGFFAVFVDVFDHALENQQVRAALACNLDAIAIVPLDRAAEHLAVVENHSHGCAGLHLLDPVKILSVSQLRWSRLLAWRGSIVAAVLGSGRNLLLHVRETRTEHPAVHHDCSLCVRLVVIPYDAPNSRRVTVRFMIE